MYAVCHSQSIPSFMLLPLFGLLIQGENVYDKYLGLFKNNMSELVRKDNSIYTHLCVQRRTLIKPT